MRPSYSTVSSLATVTAVPVGMNVIFSPIFMPTILNLNLPRLACGHSSELPSANSELPFLYSISSASSIAEAMSLKMSNATCGGTLKNSRFWRMCKSVNRSIVLWTSFSTSLYLEVFIAAYRKTKTLVAQIYIRTGSSGIFPHKKYLRRKARR